MLALLLWAIDGSSSHAAADDVDYFYDPDRDGAMSYEEFVHSLHTKTLEELDRDRDGLVSEAEGKTQDAPADGSIDVRFSEIDTDGDAQLSAKELEAATRKSRKVRVLYDAMDADHDDRVSPSEWRRSPRVGLLRIEF
jgi:hypothetical protein